MLDNLKKIKEKYNYDFISYYLETTDDDTLNDLAIKIATIADEVLKNVDVDKNFIENEDYPDATPIVTKLAETFDIHIHSKKMEKDIHSFLTVKKENIENYQTDRVIITNTDNSNVSDIVFSVAYDIGALLFDFCENKDISYNFVFKDKHETNFNFEDYSYFPILEPKHHETLTHFLCYTFALFLIMPPTKFAEDFKKLDEEKITLYDKGGILVEKYRTNTRFVEERVKIMKLTAL